MWVMGVELRSFYLQGKHFPGWVTSLALLYSFLQQFPKEKEYIFQVKKASWAMRVLLGKQLGLMNSPHRHRINKITLHF